MPRPNVLQEIKVFQASRTSMLLERLFNKGSSQNLHSVFTTIPKGMQLGDTISLMDGRNFMLCKQVGAAAVTVGKLVTHGTAVYDIDGTNEVVVATVDRQYLDFYLGGSGTALTAAEALGSYFYVISSTGLGICRRIVGHQSYTMDVSGTSRTHHRLQFDIPLNVDLAATSVCRLIGVMPEVTLYDAGAAHNSLCILGASAADASAAQNKFIFVQLNGIQAIEVDGGAAVKGSAVRGADGATTGDGKVELQVETDIVPILGVALEAIADGVIGLVNKTSPLQGNL